MKYYITDSNYVIKYKLTEDHFKAFAEELLYLFARQYDFDENNYTIDNFIKTFNEEFTTGGKDYVEHLSEYYPLSMRTKGENFIKIKLNKDYIFSSSKTDYYSIINPEFIFYNYKPKKHNIYYWPVKWGFLDKLGTKPKHYQARKTRANYGSNWYMKPGSGRQTAVIDETLKEEYKYCLDNGYRMLKPGRKIHKDSWDDWSRTKRSSGWKESTKRKHQNKPTDIY